MAKRAVSTPEAAPPGGPYSQAVVAGDHVYLAGAVPTKPDGTPVRGTFEEQARQAFTNLQKTAEASRRLLKRRTAGRWCMDRSNSLPPRTTTSLSRRCVVKRDCPGRRSRL